MHQKTLTNILVGGGIIPKTVLMDSSALSIQIILIAFLAIVIKGFLVMVTYNWMAPKLIYNVKNEFNIKDFRPLNFWEAILVIILFNNLFSRY